jgi:hypothetical protein
MAPFSISPLVTPRVRSTERNSVAKALASSTDASSGSVTISSSGTPARL